MTIATWPAHQLTADSLDGWQSHGYPGWLVVVEGVDGSGRATHLELLELWLKVQGYAVLRSDWNSSKLVARTIRDARKQHSLTPLTYSVLHATDVAARQESDIIPALKAGFVVLVDRYIFTAIARDTARGVDRDWIYNLYSFAIKPDIAVYLRIPTNLSLERIRNMAGEVSIEEAEESASVRSAMQSFVEFQDRVIQEYDRLRDQFGMVPVDAARPVQAIQVDIREHVEKAIGGK